MIHVHLPRLNQINYLQPPRMSLLQHLNFQLPLPPTQILLVHLMTNQMRMTNQLSKKRLRSQIKQRILLLIHHCPKSQQYQQKQKLQNHKNKTCNHPPQTVIHLHYLRNLTVLQLVRCLLLHLLKKLRQSLFLKKNPKILKRTSTSNLQILCL